MKVLNEWHCNLITVFCLYTNTGKVEMALREQVGKKKGCYWNGEAASGASREVVTDTVWGGWERVKRNGSQEKNKKHTAEDRQGGRQSTEGSQGERRAAAGGGGLYLEWRERGRGAKNCQQLSSPWTELSLRASAWKNTSLLFTYDSPLSLSQHQSAHKSGNMTCVNQLDQPARYNSHVELNVQLKL